MDKEDILIKICIVVCALFVILVIVLSICALANYTSYGERTGRIIDKRYTPEHTYTTMRTTYVGESTVSIPVTNYVGEKYEIKLEKEIEDKKKSIWIDITKEEYEKYSIGDFYGE
ncbi:MAG: hypothetical protein ACI4ON_00345 [Clostridia bacterium]